MNQVMWQRRYTQPDRVWSGAPNVWLTESAGDLEPGTACDVGCGEGADALWLAEREWQVTALDFAPAALARGDAHAVEAGLGDRVTWVEQDLTRWEPEPLSYDLVSVQFFHADPDVRASVHLKAWQAARRRLLVVSHDPSNAVEGNGGPPDSSVLYSASDVVDSLPLAERDRVVTSERRARHADDPQRVMWDSVVLIDRG